MVIKQKKRPGRELVEYTEEELNTLENTAVIVYVISIIVAFISCACEIIILLSNDQGSRLLQVVLVFIGCIIGCRLSQPLLKIAYRHLSISSSIDYVKVKKFLGKWFDNAGYGITLICLTMCAFINVVFLIVIRLHNTSMSGIPIWPMFGFSVLSLIIMCLWDDDSYAREKGHSMVWVKVIEDE